jgi:hypothetical protein
VDDTQDKITSSSADPHNDTAYNIKKQGDLGYFSAAVYWRVEVITWQIEHW